jgi:hypothetical protein
MNLLNTIQSSLANFKFKKELKKSVSQREVIGWEAGKKIGLLYDATNDTDFEVMKQYVKQVRSQQKEVLALGYINKKVLPQSRFPQLGLDFFTKKDMGWKMIPNNLAVSNFIKESYDIVINLSDNTIFPLSYIAAISKAKFRVGRFDKHYVHCYDMMIETNNETDMKSLIQQTEDYLKKLKASV